ncbi:uncharacterized protein LOC143913162 isoform X2 [Arctopsyche grandis]|uniref:uncharacterized protein LOC143913162 isoform X2 n=1 Tax=Arctopsyche grandis TaxID=121162 RepID=UPI00406D9FC5
MVENSYKNLPANEYIQLVIINLNNRLKMWNQNNWCEKIIVSSSGLLLSVFLYNIIFQHISYNIWLFLYTFILIVSSVWMTCYEIQFLLNQNDPLKPHSENVLAKILYSNRVRTMISSVYPKIYTKPIDKKENIPTKDAIDEAIDCESASIISSVIERKCIWSWYSQYVSKEIAFPFACKEFLDHIVVKTFQTFSNINVVNFTSDSLGIFLRHLKEYKKSTKRLEKSNKSTVEECYRKFHPTSSQRNSNATTSKSKSTQSHCLCVTKALLKELLPWELWDTPHATLIASILAKRLDAFINNCLSDPVWLRHSIMRGLAKNNEKSYETSQQTSTPNIEPLKLPTQSQNDMVLIESEEMVLEAKEAYNPELNIPAVMKTSIESALTNLISNSTAPILQRAEIEEATAKNVLQNIPNVNQEKKISNAITQPINIANSASGSYEMNHTPIMNNAKSKNTSEVKVYDRLVDGSMKTWNNDMDLECVSLGQDLLASLDGEMGFESRLGRLWEADAPESNEIWSPNQTTSTSSSAKTPHGLWFGEEDNLDMELVEESPPKNTDEAAGVMEGILDLGIAGLKKGLRLTGLQESLQDATKEKGNSSNNKSSTESSTNNLVAAIGQVLNSSRKNSQTDDTAIKLDIQKINAIPIKKDISESEKVNTPSQPLHLVKQQRVTSQDSETTSSTMDNIPLNPKIAEPFSVTIIDPIIPSAESPDYEYEEVEDFATTIAKLRYLLQQKTGDITPVPAEEALMTDMKNETRLSTSPKINSNNSPMHKVASHQYNSTKPEEIPSISSIDSDNGFTILSQNSIDLVEAEDALNQKFLNSGLPLQENNIQRLDKLFTRTVTGVFNSIKTAVGGDTTSDIVAGQTDLSNSTIDKQGVTTSITKDNWIFTKGNIDASVLIGRLLVERRSYCIVEAAQDSLDTIGVNSFPVSSVDGESASPLVPDDLDEGDIIDKCPLWHNCIEIISIVFGGVMQKDVFVKCASVATSEAVEKVLQDNLKAFSVWLKHKIISIFRDLHNSPTKTSPTADAIKRVAIQSDMLCDELMAIIPDLLCTILGKDKMQEAVQTILSSINYQLVNRDLIFNLLDVFILHFLKACSIPANGCVSTPPPSA